MKAVAEHNFAEKVGANLTQIKDFSFNMPAQVDLSKVYLIDKMFIKGVSSDRSKNESNMDY